MKKIIRGSMVSSVLFSIFLMACAPLPGHGVLKPDVLTIGEDESILVIGVTQPYYAVNFKTIDYRGPKNTPANQWLIGTPVEGYVVGHVASGITMESTTVRRTLNSEKGLMGKIYESCGGGDKAIFNVPKGKVLYLGDFDFSPSEEQNASSNSWLRLHFNYKDNIAAAAAYLKKNYPNLADRLEKADVQIIKASNACPKPTTQMFIMVPTKK